MRNLKNLSILVARQLTDDASLLMGAFFGVVAFLVLLGVIAFLYPWSQVLHAAILLFFLPFFVGVGFLVFGVSQARGDDTSGALAMLSVLPVTPGQFGLARIIAGLLCVGATIACSGMVVSGAIMLDLIQWPKTLFPRGIVDLSVALLLTGALSYSFGLSVARQRGAFVRFLGLLLLIPLFVFLPVIKGLGMPLMEVLAPLVGVLLIRQCVLKDHPRLPCALTGFVVLAVVVTSLFWVRYLPRILTSRTGQREAVETTVSSHRLSVPLDERDPSGTRFSASAYASSGILGIWNNDVRSLQPAGALIDVLEWRDAKRYGRTASHCHFPSDAGFHYDRRERLFVCYRAQGTLYSGPEGVGNVPAQSIGRFHSPVVCRVRRDEMIIFDSEDRRFYVIDTDLQEVRSGRPVFDTAFQPVDAILPRLRSEVCSVLGGSRDGRLHTDHREGSHVPVVEESGEISVLDVKSLTLRRGAGRLAHPRTLFGWGSCCPRDLFDYEAKSIFLPRKGTYAGLVVASLSRRDARATLAIFDKDGQLVKPPSNSPLSPWLLPMAYLVESLHPPILTLASFFTAYSLDAVSTHRSLFLMPNSFVALQRDRETGRFFQLLWALLFLTPALLFSGFLGWRVVKDARVLGLPWRARAIGLSGTLAFGLPAYITYRLTRPKVVMVPCRDCGRARRVDREVCHYCGKEWDMPELDPPTWRVTGSTT